MGTLSFFKICFKTYFLQGFFTINSIWFCLFSRDFLSKISNVLSSFFFFGMAYIPCLYVPFELLYALFIYMYGCVCVYIYSNCCYFLIVKMCVFVCVCFSRCILVILCLSLEETGPMYLFLFLFFQMRFSTIYHP